MSSQGYHGRGELAHKFEHDGIVGPTTGQTITGTTQITTATSGTTASIVPDAAGYIIYLPTTAAGLHYRGVTTAAGAGTVIIRATGKHYFGMINELVPTALDGSASDLNIVGGTATAGITIELHGIDATHWHVSVQTSVAGSVTAA